MMLKQNEQVICTFLYVVSNKNYVPHHLIFTSSRVLAVGSGWEKNNLFADLIPAILRFPFIGRKTDLLMIQAWSSLKNRNAGHTAVNYNDAESSEVIKMSLFSMILHEISIMPYSMVKRIVVEAYPLTNDYRVKFDVGPFASRTFLIPGYSLEEFKVLISKTPLAQKLAPEVALRKD